MLLPAASAACAAASKWDAWLRSSWAAAACAAWLAAALPMCIRALPSSECRAASSGNFSDAVVQASKAWASSPSAVQASAIPRRHFACNAACIRALQAAAAWLKLSRAAVGLALFRWASARTSNISGASGAASAARSYAARASVCDPVPRQLSPSSTSCAASFGASSAARKYSVCAAAFWPAADRQSPSSDWSFAFCGSSWIASFSRSIACG